MESEPTNCSSAEDSINPDVFRGFTPDVVLPIQFFGRLARDPSIRPEPSFGIL